jgi:hypothetical protein
VGPGLPEPRSAVISAMRFLWIATKGHRLRPWRSAYVRWRIETYSGISAESLSALDVMRFFWREKLNLLRFLHWAGTLEKAATTGKS